MHGEDLGASSVHGSRFHPDLESPQAEIMIMQRPILVLSIALLSSPSFAQVAADDSDGKIARYTEAIRLDPKNALNYSERGIAWLSKRQYDKAIEDFSEVIRLDPRNFSAYGNRGMAWASKKETEKAFDDYDESIRLNPKNVLLYGNRGNA